ncbi:MAG: tetratricopeptide repeat protein [Candidatus Dadabacteria bacterium]|nr:tetratricopeptide repeat protein [Candidatus Dadabacteria bacterium]NIS09154.1 tetratricopeptide repeat protein [Candidatus Dadabacteria bacterium]NIY22461.1 tetratricopeptide repeat protein [Candidatus Dadabacteria bacterium]
MKKLLLSITFISIISSVFACGGASATKPKDGTTIADQKTLAVSSFKRRNYKQALEEIDVAEQMDPKDPEVHLIRGIILFAIQDLEGAEKSYKKAIELKPEYSEAHFNICGLFLNLERYDQAIAHCKKATDDRLYKSRDRAFTAIGVAYFNKGDLDMAENYYEKSLRVNPSLVYTRNQLGKLYVAQGRLHDAIDEFQAAVTGYQLYDEAHYNLGITYLKLKETFKACSSFKRVLEVAPNGEWGRKAKNYTKSVCDSVY